MKLRIVFVILLALLAAACSRGISVGPSSGRSTSTTTTTTTTVEAGSNGYCQPRKHACEKYEKEKGKKNPQQAKIDRYYRECAEYNRSCR
jgi:ABC-type glycerol-3-phosphate transport system substrate-binding protein